MKLALLLLAALGAAFALPAGAQSTSGAGRVVVVPLIAQTSTFQSDVTVLNPNGNTITVAVKYYDANNLATAGQQPCANLVIPGNRSVHFSIAAQCTLASPSASHFGMLILEDTAQVNYFYAYSRVGNFQQIGFTTEGFPLPNFSNQPSVVPGLRSTNSGSPIYQSNCFAGSLDDPVDYQITLFDGTTGAQLGNPVTGSLGARQIVRYLDIFGQAGVPPGNYSNVRAEFVSLSIGEQKLIGFCTLQENAFFSTDFRIAKSFGFPGGYTVRWGSMIGPIGGSAGGFAFAGGVSTVIVPAGASQRLTGTGSASMAVTGGGGPQAVDVALCYQDQAGGSVTPFNGSSMSVEFDTVRRSYQAADSVLLSPATYHVGLCVKNSGPLTIGDNDWSIGWVDVTPQ